MKDSMKVKGKRIGNEWRWMVLTLTAIALLVFSSTVAVAQMVTVSDPIKINAEPASIPADGVSKSTITVSVVYPETEDYISIGLNGTSAANVLVEMRINWAENLDTITLTDAENENNTGDSIPLGTDKNGTAVALLSGKGNESGTAKITVEVPDFNYDNFIFENSTTVTFLEAEATPTAPSGDGDSGGIPTTPPAGTLPYIDLSANPADIPADGVSTSTITASVWDEEKWVLENLTVNFSTDLGDITASALIENGTATAILTAWIEPGTATITAEANLDGDMGILTNTTTVNFTTQDVTPTPPVLTPTVTVTPTPMATVSPAPSPTKKPLIPGFEAVFAIASLLSVAYLVMRRERKA